MDEEGTMAAEEAVALDGFAALAAREEDSVGTPEAFLTGVSEGLKAVHDVDVGLAAILSDHLLTVTPHANAVVNAKAAILALAARRAAPAEEQADV